MFLEVDKRMKACICEGVSLLMNTGPAEGKEDLYTQNRDKVLERIRLTGIQLTEALLKTRGSQDLPMFAQTLFRRLNNTLGFLETLKENWKEKKKEATGAAAFDLVFCDELQASLTRKRDLLTSHIPSFLYAPYFTVASLKDALLEAESYAKQETDEKVIMARRLAYVFAQLEQQGLLYKLPEVLLFEWVLIYVNCSPDYIRQNLLAIKDGYKGDLTKGTAWKYMDEARDFLRRFRI